MGKIRVVLFEDKRVNALAPVTLTRPAATIRCGSRSLLEMVQSLGHPVTLLTKPYLQELVQADHPDISQTPPALTDRLLLVNSRLVPSPTYRQRLSDLIAANKSQVLTHDGVTVAALVNGDISQEVREKTSATLHTAPGDWAQELNLPVAPAAYMPLFDYPHDIVRYHLEVLQDNIAERLQEKEKYTEVMDGVFLAEGAKLGEYCVADTSEGPIVVESDAKIGPYCFLSGPAHIGERAKIIEHSAIKDAVALGHTTKIGGEVEASIIEPYTNKQHHGFLGHSYLGSWVNLGAGTTNSDLKNTYGTVAMSYNGKKVETGMQFLGCIVGDYSKTAINTCIFTGKVIGVAAMAYGFVTTNVPSFANYARTFGQVTEVSVEVIIAMQARMFARRGIKQRECDKQLIHAMYELTDEDRKMTSEPLTL